MEHYTKESFQNTIQEAYELLGAKTPLELSQRYTEEDQKLMKAGEWDYLNQDLIVNKVRNILENIDENKLTPAEKEERKEILWFWYHHAVSCAIWRYKDKEKAVEYVNKALNFQPENHPNKITKLFSLLLEDKTEEVEDWIKTVSGDEKEAADFLLSEYNKGNFPG